MACLHMQVILNKNSLSTELVITNTDKKPFSFSTALHTYFSVSARVPCSGSKYYALSDYIELSNFPSLVVLMKLLVVGPLFWNFKLCSDLNNSEIRV